MEESGQWKEVFNGKMVNWNNDINNDYVARAMFNEFSIKSVFLKTAVMLLILS